jgi:hypothetical protein
VIFSAEAKATTLSTTASNSICNMSGPIASTGQNGHLSRRAKIVVDVNGRSSELDLLVGDGGDI